jgi:hypothetical protein
MSDLKQSILKLSNEGSPIVIFSNSGGISLQQMPDNKWSKLTEPHKNKIRKYVANRNEKLLDAVTAENLTEIESHVLKYTGKAPTQSETPQTQSDPINSTFEGEKEEEQTFEDKFPLSEKEEKEEKEEEEEEEEKEETTDDDDEEYKKHQFNEEETIDKNSDLDLTPNFVNTFFGYIDSLLVKKKEVEQVNSPEIDNYQKPTQATDKTPDYSDPNAEVFSNTPLPEGWTEHVSTSSDPGKKYYFNEKTGETVWERPVGDASDKGESVSGEVKEVKEVKEEEDELLEGWTEHVSTSSDPGKKYYFNEKTGETVWEKPVKKREDDETVSDPQSSQEKAEPSQSEWTEHVSTSSDPGKTYYYNEKTGETVWEKPPGFEVNVQSEQTPSDTSDTKNKFNAKDKQVVPGQCFNCGSTENLNLKTYKLESDKAVPVSFCCFKCFESVEF